ncbi:MAG: hypothetical protein GYB65_02490 [Chloroflexi bacterium]|nr:hypothetical protein [Chloroflexota bacterium]
MRKLTLILTTVTLLAALVLLPAQPPTVAQDGTPAPELTPLPNYGNDPLVVALPFGESFDRNEGWQPDGAWVYDVLSAYSGAGWFADISPRQATSNLTYERLIDLSGTLSVQLVYRQKGYLPPSDLIALDISLDGGMTWLAVDQQIGLESPDWDTRTIDLTDFRGQVISLRFRVATGIETTLPPESGYRIDSLTIQFVAATPTMVYVPVETPPRTLMGLHLIVGARREPVLELATRLRDIGWPLGTVKGTSGTEDILNEVARISPDTVIVFRSLLTPLGQRDCPNTANSPQAEAQLWMAGLQQYWAGVNADYYEIVNECEPPMEWMAAFSIEAMRIANLQGQCLLLFSFGPGNPEPEEFAQLLPVFQYALENPCGPGRLHGIALHTYGIGQTTLVSESGIYLGFRHRLFYSTILTQLPEAVRLPVYLTEAGPGDGRTDFTCADVQRDVMQYTQQLEYDPYIQGFHLWNLGPPGVWVDFTPCLPIIGDALVNYYANK